MRGFTEGGLLLHSSVAEKMLALTATTTPAGPYVAAITGAPAFVAEVVEALPDESFPKTHQSLGEAVEHLRSVLRALDQSIAAMGDVAGLQKNRQTLRRLMDCVDEVCAIHAALAGAAEEPERLVVLANRAGWLADAFLENDYEIWRWTDVVVQGAVDPRRAEADDEFMLAHRRFKHLPTLPAYLLAVLTWLAAREQAVRLGAGGRLEEDGGRVRRHLDAVSVRPVFRKTGPEELNMDGSVKWTVVPATIPENIKARIVSTLIAGSDYPVERLCHFWFEVQNWMTGEQQQAGPFTVMMVSDDVACTLDPSTVGTPAAELEAEELAGTAALEELRRTLARVVQNGTACKPSLDRFPSWVAAKAGYYAVNAPGQLLWFEHTWTSAEPGVPVGLAGPRSVAFDWHRFTTVLAAGGNAIYAVEPDGTLLCYWHEGAGNGHSTLSDPVTAGSGWNSFTTLISGGGGVLYALEPDGTLWWHKHDGFANGSGRAAWRAPSRVAGGWHTFKTIFSGGEGILYGVKSDGTLIWHKHNGFADGAPDWETPVEVASGWQHFTHIFGTGDGVIYARQPNGPLLWHRHESWKTGKDYVYAMIGGVRMQLSMAPIAVWKGPIPVGDDTARYASMFGMMGSSANGAAVKL